MKQGAWGTRRQGMLRPWHVIVLLIFLVLTGMLTVYIYVGNFRSDAQGEARDLFFDTADYLTACALGETDFRANREDEDYYYITRAKTLAPYHKGEIKGEILIKIDKKMEPIYASTTFTRSFFGTYLLKSTEVYPKDSVTVKGLEWIEIQPEEKLEENAEER